MTYGLQRSKGRERLMAPFVPRRRRWRVTRAWRFVWRLLKETISKFVRDGGSFLAAGLAFNLLLYCVPFLLIIVSTLSYTLGSPERALAQVQTSAKKLLPQSSGTFVDILSTIIAHRNLVGVVAVLLFFVLSSMLFGAIRHVLNVVFEVRSDRSYFKSYLRQTTSDLVLILMVACLVLLSIGIGSLLTIMRTISERSIVVYDLLKPGWVLATHVVLFLFMTTLFYTFYRFSRAQTVSHRAAIVAAMFGAGLFSLSKWAFVWYVMLAKGNIFVYGTLAGIMFFYLWLYYACLVFILAAELGWVFDQNRRRASV